MNNWKVGDMARIAVMGGPRWVRVLSIDGNRCTVLSERGNIDYLGLQSLLTLEGCLAHCDYMRDDWTGREYREMQELARKPFVPPDNWEVWIERAMEPYST